MNEHVKMESLQEEKNGLSNLALAGNNLSFHQFVITLNYNLTVFIKYNPYELHEGCEMCNTASSNHDLTIKTAELKWTGQTYTCGNCNAILIPPSQKESDLKKQLNIQRIQQQIELEAIQHQQRMKYLQTLLHS